MRQATRSIVLQQGGPQKFWLSLFVVRDLQSLVMTQLHTVRRVCVVGAGVSGVVAAAHLHAAGVEVTVFERSSVAGGVWYVHIDRFTKIQ